MKEITFKRIELLNFKGIKNLTVDFKPGTTTISGCNGSGKTTIFDAATWVLFGKDSHDSKFFGIKTLDENGKAIEKIPHEVKLLLLVDGEEIELTKQYNEKWVTKRGSSVEEFSGHEESRFYNGVPMSVAEWQQKIDAICTEDVFKFITNPLYFSAQKTDVKRAMLFRMAGNVSDSDIFATREDFSVLVDKLQGKTIAELQREVAAKKRTIKSEIDSLPARIDERHYNTPEPENWSEIEQEIAAKVARFDAVSRLITDDSALMNEKTNERVKMAEEIGKWQLIRQEIAGKIRTAVQAEYHQKLTQQYSLHQEQKNLMRGIEDHKKEVAMLQGQIDKCTEKRNELVAEWKKITDRTFTYDENEFVCPTCGRRYEISEVEAKLSDMRMSFNTQKANDLAVNQKAGKDNNEVKNMLIARLNAVNEDLADLEKRLAALEEDELLKETLVCPDAQPSIEADPEYRKYGEWIKAKTAEVEAMKVDKTWERVALETEKDILTTAIGELKARLSKKQVIEQNEARIKELEIMLNSQRVALAELEGIEYMINEFNKAKIEAIEGRINGLFETVRFKMYEKQINGGEKEVCEATVNGVPFDGGLNNAGRINAGLDIIHAICKFEGVMAPIFIDNAEGVNDLFKTDSQQVRLVVTNKKGLKVE